MRVLVFGKTGQVATQLQRAASVVALGRAEADLTSPRSCTGAISAHKPDAVINAAAWTAVDAAEDHEAEAYAINAEAPGAMARACAGLSIPLVHISTDYVFSGEGDEAWRPTDETVPLGAYGRTKLAGEEAVRAAGGVHAILRTSWVFSAHGANFLKTMLRLGSERDRLNIVADQIGGPTPAADIARVCLTIAGQLVDDPGKTGTYHYSGAPELSWAGFARAIFEAAGLECKVEDIPTSAYPTPARRPLNSRLDCSTTENIFGLSRPDWRSAVKTILSELETGKATT